MGIDVPQRKLCAVKSVRLPASPTRLRLAECVWCMAACPAIVQGMHRAVAAAACFLLHLWQVLLLGCKVLS